MLAAILGLFAQGIWAAGSYGLPDKIQDGNILHCFDWPIKDVKAELPNIAAAGFGAVQLSPLQRSDVRTGSSWHDLYRPYDIAFKGGIGTRDELKALCAEAEKYGIKVIVDIVANHVDKTSGYHDPWWDSNGRVRWNGGINYGDRYSITHGQLGDYGDINSESAEVQARAKAYIEDLKSMGVKGCRWDAAKHIGLPSENCNFWSTVTSVPGIWHYGEILDNPGPNESIIKEYAQFMSVTDNDYSNSAARSNGGIPYGHGGKWAVNHGLGDKVVYWGESHDTYSNDEWSQNVDQSVIDRAYCSFACRNGATALYFSRPNAKGFGNIKVGKGSTAFKNKHIAEVNKFRNLMVGKEDYFSSGNNAISVTRKGGGAVIVMKGSGNVSIANGGGYCPAGTYTDHVSGGTFTVTATTISGNVGSSGVAVLYNGGDNPNPPTPPTPPSTSVTISGDYNIAYSGDKSTLHYWGGASETTWPGVAMTSVKGSDGNMYKCAKVVSGTTGVIFNNNGNDQTADLTYTNQYVMDDNGATSTAVTFNGGDNPNPPTPPSDGSYCYFINDGGWNVKVWAWNDAENCNSNGSWPGDSMTEKNGKLYWEAPAGKTPTMIIFSNNGGEKAGGGDLKFVNGATYKSDGTYTTEPDPSNPVVTASPASGTRFADNISVTLSVSPAATIYYTLDGSNPTTSSTKYTAPIKLTATTTIKAYGVTASGSNGSVATFTYTKSDNPGPVVDPNATNLITEYYKVNPGGKVGTRKTIKMSFSGEKSTTAFSNWTDSELIAQGVARDVSQAFRGLHERPIVDSYAIYAAYDNDNLYLGVQFVYTVWDLYGEGKQPGESKPYNMDGHMLWAFDLDPAKSFDGYINGQGPIWNEQAKGAKFNNGVDAVWMGSTKAGVGTPGFFIPTPDGHASYDAAYCKSIPGRYYGYADGLLPSIDAIWGLPFGSEPDELKGNTGFTDLRSEIDDTAHTFYEWTFPLSVLGVTADYIANNGIGVMYIDKYGTSPVGGTPYDPSYFDNVKDEYSYGDNTSAEKEDEDIITYAPARVGKLKTVSVDNIAAETATAVKVYAAAGKLYIVAPSAGKVSVTDILGATTTYEVEQGTNVIDTLSHGFYIVEGKKVVL